ncbi:MAG: hypothetical protein LPK80_06260 [Bacteroidota bacterium]|nr:hypothetical protein [Bacteroidota bacterium]MDX5427549.1 hypothetical protein [Bacteroidota bacterium]MDX5447460.1 hypothetical protein [Bacteroidota bacterium]MDX5505475.1 hypothetical protein [Bacteroidota bacterium]
MKHLKFAFWAVLFVGFSSCEDLEQICGVDNPDLSLAENGVEALGVMINTYDRVDEALRNSDLQNNGQTTIDNASVTWSNNLLTIDFGNGTSGSDGKIRKGTITAQVTGDYFQSGSTTTISFNGFSVDDHSVKGGISLSNSTQNMPTYTVSATNFVFDDLVGLTNQMTFEWQAGFNTQSDDQDDIYSLSGNGNIDQLSGDQDLGLDIVIPIKYVRACQWGVEEGALNCAWTGTDAPFSSIDLDFISSDGCNNLYQIGVDCGETSGTITKSFSGF